MNRENQPHLIAIVGATGTGKSGLSLDLAAALAERGQRAEVINADAMQLYRGMDIGTAKLTLEERRGIRHHLLDVLDVTEEATVADYQPKARSIIDECLARGVWPILVGGSGLYVSSVLYEFDFPGSDPAIRQALEKDLDVHGLDALYRRLETIDPASAARIGPHNGRRIVRALEVADITGRPVSGSLPAEPVLWRPTSTIMLTADRAELVSRLDKRVTQMWENGLLDEVATLREQGLERGVTARRAIGYAQAVNQLNGTLSAEEAQAQTQQLTRRYARRQVGWFARYPGLLSVEGGSPLLTERVLENVLGSGHRVGNPSVESEL